MNVKSNATRGTWIDPDDAPELTDDFFENATPMIGDRVVTKKEFAMAAEEAIRNSKPTRITPQQSLTMLVDADIVAVFKATGDGWQARMNEALRDWLKTNSP